MKRKRRVKRQHTQPDGLIVYLAKRGNLYKIGCTIRWRQRIGGIEQYAREFDGQDIRVELLHVIVTPDAKVCELALHERFAHRRAPMGKEWFHLTAVEVEEICAVRQWPDDRVMPWRWEDVD